MTIKATPSAKAIAAPPLPALYRSIKNSGTIILVVEDPRALRATSLAPNLPSAPPMAAPPWNPPMLAMHVAGPTIGHTMPDFRITPDFEPFDGSVTLESV